MEKEIPVNQRQVITGDEWSTLVDPNDVRLPRYKMYGFHGDEEELHPTGVLAITFILTLAIICRIISIKLRYIPNQMFLMCVSWIIALCLFHFGGMEDYANSFMVSPKIYEHILMPLIIIRTTLLTDYHTFAKCFSQLMLIAVVRFSIEVIVLGAMMQSAVYIEVPFVDGLLFGAIVAPIYPSSVIMLLKDLGTFQHLSTLIELEAVFTITISKSLIVMLIGVQEQLITEWYHYVNFFIRHIGGGIIFGFICGRLTIIFMMFFQNYASQLIIFTISISYTIFSLMENAFDVSTYLVMTIVGLFLSNQRPILTSDIEKTVVMIWDCFYNVVYNIVFVSTHVVTAICVITQFQYDFIGSIIILYIASNVLRCVTYLMVYPFARRVGYGLSIPTLIVLSLTNSKDVTNMLFALYPYILQDFETITDYYVTHVFIIEMVVWMVNCTFMSTLLSLLGLSEISIPRRTNMNNCLKFIWKKRMLYLPILKCNRFYAAANWTSINEATVITHPYRLNISDDDDEESVSTTEATCPECNRTFYIETTSTERDEMLKEIHMRIIKAKRISYIKQYESGLLNTSGKYFLLYTLEIAKDLKPLDFSYIDIDKLFDIPLLIKLSNHLKKWRVDAELEFPVPSTRNREICYYIVMHTWFDPTVYIIAVLFSVVSGLASHYNLTYNIFLVCFIFKLICLLLLWTEFFLKINAYSSYNIRLGILNYSRSFWNILDFLLLLIITNSCLIGVISYYPITQQALKFGENVILYQMISAYISYSYCLRLLKMSKFIMFAFAKIVENIINKKYERGYNYGKAIITSDEEIQENLPQLVEDAYIYQQLVEKLEERRKQISTVLKRITKERPWIAVTVKSKQAMYSILSILRRSTLELRHSGYIDMVEFVKLNQSITNAFKCSDRHHLILPSPPKVLFKEIPWMANEPDIINLLYQNVQMRSFDTDDVIFYKAEISEYIYVLVTGLLKLKYIPPTEQELQNQDIGALPIIDYLSTMNFSEPIEDVILSGNSIGELSILTNRPYSCQITGDSPGQLYLIKKEVILKGFKIFNDDIYGLEARLWKAATVHLASIILLYSPQYQFHTTGQIKEYIDRGFVPNLSNFKVLVLTDLIQDVLLIDGVCADCITKEIFIAPYYIPRAAIKILMNKSYINLGSIVNTKLMIIPMKDIDPCEIMKRLIELAEMGNAELHLSVRKQMKRTYFLKKRQTSSFNKRASNTKNKFLKSEDFLRQRILNTSSIGHQSMSRSYTQSTAVATSSESMK